MQHVCRKCDLNPKCVSKNFKAQWIQSLKVLNSNQVILMKLSVIQFVCEFGQLIGLLLKFITYFFSRLPRNQSFTLYVIGF